MGYLALPFIILWLVLCYFKLTKWFKRFNKCKEFVVATVVDVKEKKAKSSHVPIYKPIYSVYDGDKELIIDSEYFSQYEYKVGDTVSLYIDPDDCSRFIHADKRLVKRAVILDIICCLIPLIFIVSILLY